MRERLLCAGLAVVMLGTAPGAAQSLGERFERIFGPPVSQDGTAPVRRPSRDEAPARRAPTPPDPDEVPLPQARPDDAAPTDAPAGEPAAATGLDGAEDDTAAASTQDAPTPDPEADDTGDTDAVDEAPPSAEMLAVEEAQPEQDAPDEAAPDEAEAPEPQDVPTPAPAERAADEADAGEEADTPEDTDTDTPTAPRSDDEAGPEPDAAPPEREPTEAAEEEPAPAPAYVSPERARTVPEPAAPDVEPAGVTPDASVEAAAAVKDAQACEAELRERGAEFTVGPSVADGACGVLRPIQLTRFSAGTAMAPETQMLCRTALALDVWVSEALVPAAREHLGEDAPATLRHASTYVCRDRASENGLSEHGKGSAVDIGSFEWEGRAPIVIEAQPADSPEDRFLADIRRAACGPFMTVLGPGTDADHAEHFHFDIAARSNGSTYCR